MLQYLIFFLNLFTINEAYKSRFYHISQIQHFHHLSIFSIMLYDLLQKLLQLIHTNICTYMQLTYILECLIKPLLHQFSTAPLLQRVICSNFTMVALCALPQMVGCGSNFYSTNQSTCERASKQTFCGSAAAINFHACHLRRCQARAT